MVLLITLAGACSRRAHMFLFLERSCRSADCTLLQALPSVDDGPVRLVSGYTVILATATVLDVGSVEGVIDI